MLDPQDYTGTYKVIAGELCLDFANTVSWRGREREHEWLHNFSNYVAWGQMVGILTAEDAQAMLDEADRNPEKSDAVLKQATGLREAINRIFSTINKERQPQMDDIIQMNSHLPEVLVHLTISAEDNKFIWDWSSEGVNLDRIIWPVVWSAANLLMSDALKHLGTCEGCDWLFIDTSRNHSRRWCTMEDCGNRAKVRRYRKQCEDE